MNNLMNCDICGESCIKENWDAGTVDEMYVAEHADLKATWGYWSRNKDCQKHHCRMCEGCYDKVRDFILKELKGKIRGKGYLINEDEFEVESK